MTITGAYLVLVIVIASRSQRLLVPPREEYQPGQLLLVTARRHLLTFTRSYGMDHAGLILI
jgi:hypothetical protein